MNDWLTNTLVLSVLLVTSFTSVGLLALWAATSSRHWLLRCAAVLVVLSPFALISAYPAWLLFMLQTCTIVTGVKIWRWFAARREKDDAPAERAEASGRFITLRFTIRTLLAMACMVAMLTPVGVPLVEQMRSFGAWGALFVSGVCGGLAVLIGAWMSTSARKRIAHLTAFLLLLLLACLAATWCDRLFTSFGGLFDENPSKSAWCVVLPLLTLNTWLLLRLWFVGAAVVVGKAGRMPRRTALQLAARSFFWLLLIVLVLPAALVLWELSHPLPIPSIHVPDPNGIDDVVAAGEAFGRSPILSAGVEPKSTEELAAEVTKYTADYDRLRLGLERDILAHVWARDGEIDTQATMFGILDTVQAARQAARGLDREAELAHRQQRYGDSAKIALDTMRLGQAISKDGLLVASLTGMAIEGMGHASLYKSLSNLSSDECHSTISRLVEHQSRCESLDDLLLRERIVAENMYGYLWHFLTLLQQWTSSDGSEQAARLAHARNQAATRLLIAELGVRAFHLERGKLPDQLEQLTPEFLAELPVDPFDPSNVPLRYLRTDDGYVLYSIGGDGDDDRGRLPAWDVQSGWDLTGDGDLRLGLLLAPDYEVGDSDMKSSE